MSEILMQTIIEKLESLEISFLKNSPDRDNKVQQELLKEVRNYQSEITKIIPQVKSVNEKINDLTKNVTAINFGSVNKATGQIHHTHYFHRGLWIAIALFITSLFLLYGWINSYNAKNVSETNDIKYRYLKVNGNIGLLKLLYRTDSLYTLNKQLFKKMVAEKEDALAQQMQLHLAGEKEKRKVNLKNKNLKEKKKYVFK
jgi:hypothetical protein